MILEPNFMFNFMTTTITPLSHNNVDEDEDLGRSQPLTGDGASPGFSMQMAVKDRRTGALGDLAVLLDEVICNLLSLHSPGVVARLSCVSSVMYIFCNEEPLWMSLCLKSASGLLEYKESRKKTTLLRENTINGDAELQMKPLHFDGFYSLFLYRRLYRCYTSLDGFCVDNGNVEKKSDLSFEEFHNEYDGKRPVAG